GHRALAPSRSPRVNFPEVVGLQAPCSFKYIVNGWGAIRASSVWRSGREGSMVFLVILMAVLLPMLLAAAFLLGRHLHRHRPADDDFSPVTRQHFELFQGAQINEAAVEAAKHRFSDLLDRGEVASVEASLRPGMHYVFQIRALAEIGTDVAGR